MTLDELNKLLDAKNVFHNEVRNYEKMKALTLISLYFDGHHPMEVRDKETIGVIQHALCDLARQPVLAAIRTLNEMGVDVSWDNDVAEKTDD